MGKVISFINYKGGVGKTTTTYHVGCALALFHGKRVLLIDVDPQANLTFLCATPGRWETFKRVNGTIADLFNAYLKDSFETYPMSNVIWKSPIETYANGKVSTDAVRNLDLTPSDVDLLGIDIDLAAKTWRKIESGFFQEQLFIWKRSVKRTKEFLGLNTSHDIRDALFYLEQRRVLKRFVDTVRDNYDYVLIDCPPNLYLITQNALAASDSYVITTIPDHMSTIGINILMRKIKELHNTLNQKCRLADIKPHDLALKGILFTLVRTAGQGIVSTHKNKIEELRKEYLELCFEGYISWGAGYTEAAAQTVPVFLMDDENARRVAGQYQEATKEFLTKIGD